MGSLAHLPGLLATAAASAVVCGLAIGNTGSDARLLSVASEAPVAGEGTYESGDVHLVYGGEWTVNEAVPEASGGEVRYSAKEGSSVTLELEGAAVTWVTAKGPAEGVAKVWLDGIYQPEVDLYHSGTMQWQVHQRYPLSAGQHRITIQVSRSRNVNSGGYNVTVDGFIVESAPPPAGTATPTSTPPPASTPTPTPTAQLWLEAAVGLQRPLGASASSRLVPLTLRVLAAGAADPVHGPAIFSDTRTTDADGVARFDLVGVGPGRYDLYLRGSHTLGRLASGVELAAGSNAVRFGTLLEGDLNGDEVVDGADFDALADRFGLRSGEAGFDAVADLSGDGVIDISDFSLLAGSYGRAGPLPAP